MILVLQLDKRSAELCQVVIHHILERLAGQARPVLDQLDMAYGIDDIGIDIPQRGVADQIRPVVEEPGRTDYLAVLDGALLDQLGRLGGNQPCQGIPFLLGTKARRQDRKAQRQEQKSEKASAHQSNLVFQTSRVKSQSRNIGSMTI